MKRALKSVYRKIPLKHELFKILKRFWQPSESVFKHLHFQGTLDLEIKNKKFKMQHYGYMIENAAFWQGLDNGWEKVSMNLWSRLAADAQVIFDIGANTGIYALTAQTVNPQAQVYAFEPVKRVFKKLKHNAELNDYPIRAFELAASNENGTATIYDSPEEHVLAVTVNKDLSLDDVETIPTEIEIVRLDTIIEREGIDRIDLMKIDVETHEREVLEGMGGYLAKFKPDMLVEILNDEVGQEVEKLVKNLGYLYFKISEKNNLPERVECIRQSDYFNYLLCKPETAHKLKLI